MGLWLSGAHHGDFIDRSHWNPVHKSPSPFAADISILFGLGTGHGSLGAPKPHFFFWRVLPTGAIIENEIRHIAGWSRSMLFLLQLRSLHFRAHRSVGGKHRGRIGDSDDAPDVTLMATWNWYFNPWLPAGCATIIRESLKWLTTYSRLQQRAKANSRFSEDSARLEGDLDLSSVPSSNSSWRSISES